MSSENVLDIKIFGAPFASRLLELSRARVCILPAPQSQSPKLETTRSLPVEVRN